jgi:ADP-ribose pyrophosphatase YjhB (NUDIX family)
MFSTRVYVVIRVGDDILLTKNWLSLHLKWRLPGGGINNNETAELAAQRELKEELGINIAVNQLQPISQGLYKSILNYNFYLFNLNLAQKPSLKIRDYEIYQADFINVNRLKDLRLNQPAKMAVKISKLV